MTVQVVPGRHALRSVAILDDDAAFREALANGIAALGYATAQFGTPAELWDYLAAATPICLLLDYHLQGTSGLEVQAELAQRHPGLPVAFISASLDQRIRRKAIRAGAVAFLTKPVRLAEVEQLLAGLVSEG